MKELKECPFQNTVKDMGHNQYIEAVDVDNGKYGRVCCTCGATGPIMDFSEIGSIEGWNTRDSDARIAELEQNIKFQKELLERYLKTIAEDSAKIFKLEQKIKRVEGLEVEEIKSVPTTSARADALTKFWG